MRLLKNCLKMMCLLAMMLLSPITRANDSSVHLVLDARNAPILPRNFRVLPEQHIAGGAQFSELGLKRILQQLHAKHITVIDLREESHGFLDGSAISWYGYEDAANANKTPNQINKDQRVRLAALSMKKHVIVDRVLSKSVDGAIVSIKPIEFVVREVLSEEALLYKHHLRYRRVYVQDFHAPSNRETDRFIQIVTHLPAHQWVFFHCHAGVGRTTTAMVMVDMMKNAKNTTFAAILARQQAIGGKDLTAMPNAKSFKREAAEARMDFLRKFYDYARENKDRFKTSWSEWLQLKHFSS